MSALRLQIRVVSALMLREVMSRFGHDNIGFFWIIGEPMLLTVGVMGLWSLTGQTHGATIGVVPFALTGYSCLTLWRHLIFKSMRVMTNSSSLVYHVHVKFIDILLSRALLELISIFAAFIVVLIPLWLFDLSPGIQDPIYLIGGWFLYGWFSFSFALIISALSEFSETVERFVGPIMYFTMPLTGAFFMVDWLPPDMQKIVLLSPLVNAQELFRAGMFPLEMQPTEWSATYIVTWNFFLTAIALPLVSIAQSRVEAG